MNLILLHHQSLKRYHWNICHHHKMAIPVKIDGLFEPKQYVYGKKKINIFVRLINSSLCFSYPTSKAFEVHRIHSHIHTCSRHPRLSLLFFGLVFQFPLNFSGLRSGLFSTARSFIPSGHPVRGLSVWPPFTASPRAPQSRHLGTALSDFSLDVRSPVFVLPNDVFLSSMNSALLILFQVLSLFLHDH